MFIFPLVVIVVLALYAVSIYNNLQTIKTRITASLQEIGNQLKRQVELIPNLVESAKAYLKHEKDIFKQLTEARKMIETATGTNDVGQIGKAQDMVQKVLGSLRVIVESNPQLQAAGVITDLMNELRDTADKVMYARRTLIDLSADFNRILVTFPSNIIAGIFGFKAEAGLQMPDSGEFKTVTAEETKTPKVKLE